MNGAPPRVKLALPPRKDISWTHGGEPFRFYYWPFVGRLYRDRYEYCLGQCRGGERILEVGYGSGLALMQLQYLYKEVYGLDLHTNASEAMAAFRKQGINARLAPGNILDLPYEDGFFDTVLAISVLEHLHPNELPRAMREMDRVLKPKGQLVYGVPIHRRVMTMAFGALGYNIRKHHFSSEMDVARAAGQTFQRPIVFQMKTFLGPVYEIANWEKGMDSLGAVE